MKIQPEQTSITEHTARALWLVRLGLVDERARDADIKTALRIRLADIAGMDEAVCRRIVERCFKAEPGLLENVDALTRDFFETLHGLPRFHSDGRLRHLSRVVDPGALACLDARLHLAEGDRYDWPAIPVGDAWKLGGLLRDESVESHIHLNGVLPPLYYWVSIMGGEIPLRQIELFLTDQKKTPSSAQIWREALTEAMFLRLRLAARVQQGFYSAYGYKVFAHLPSIANEPSAPRSKPASLDPQCRWSDMLRPTKPTTWAQVRDVALSLSRPQRLSVSLERRCCFALADPLRLYPGVNEQRWHYAEGERRVLIHAARLLRDEPENKELEADLLEYLRIRNAFHQKLIHDHGTTGLLRFVDSFDRRWRFSIDKRRGPHTNPMEAMEGRESRHRRISHRRRRLAARQERDRMATALDGQLRDAFDDPQPSKKITPQPLRRLEMRVTLPDGQQLLHTLRAWLMGIADHIRADLRQQTFHHSQVGLVIHFIKSSNPQCQAKAVDQAQRLARLLTSYPGLRPYIVGIDAAGNERLAAPRQFAQAFHIMWNTQKDLRPRPGEPHLCLGGTFHVGEDADDMLTALRHIDETVRLLLPQPQGGRLGHALLLGQSPQAFYQRRREVEVMLGTHLLDLVWAQGKLTDHSKPEHVQWLRARTEKLIDGSLLGPDLETCYRAMLECADALVKRRRAGGKTPDDPVWSEAELLEKIKFKDDPAKPLSWHPDLSWLDMVAQIQKLLREELVKLPIAIEANPSSNLIIGGYSRYQDLPYRVLVEAGLPLSINTDDPGLFVSSLPYEFSALYEMLVPELGHRNAQRWLGDRLEDANQGSFLSSKVPVGADHPALEKDKLNALFCYRPDCR